MSQVLAEKEGASHSILRPRMVIGEPVIIVGKRATLGENVLRLRLVLGGPVTIVGKKATLRENVLKVQRVVKPLVGVGGLPLQEVTMKSRV